MIIIHARWVQSIRSHTQGLHLWAEDMKLYNSPQAPLQEHYNYRKHPFAASSRKLHNVLKKLPKPLAGKANSLLLALPSIEESPIPSFSEDLPKKSIPSLWHVESIVLDPATAIEFLLSTTEDTSKIMWQPLLNYWRDVAKCGLHAVANQSFMPNLTYTGIRSNWRSSGYSASWKSQFLDHELKTITALAQAMPEALSSVCYGTRFDEFIFSTPLNIVQDLVNCCIDNFVRPALEEEKLSTLPELQGIANYGLKEWLCRLASKDNALQESYSKISTISKRLDEWQRSSSIAKQPLQTVLRLSPLEQNEPEPLQAPKSFDEEPQNKQIQTNHQPNWDINFLVSPQTDPTLMIPAQAIWDTDSHDYAFITSFYADPQKRLRTDLEKLGTLFAPCQKAVHDPAPEQVTISHDEALDFLQNVAPKLEDQNIKLQLPTIFQEKQKKFSLKLYIKRPTKQVKPGTFGVENLLEYDWRIALGDQLVTKEEFEQLAELKKPLVHFRGQWIQMNEAHAQKTLDILRKSAQQQSMSLQEALRLGYGNQADKTGLEISGLEGDEWATDFLEKLQKPDMLPLVNCPLSFQGELRPYQTVGLSWLIFLESVGLGACLADDMGLGKTIQIIAWLLYKQKIAQQTATKKTGPQTSNLKVLLICPMSVVSNWQKELLRFAPSLKFMVHHGAQRYDDEHFKSQVDAYDIIITTYSLAGRDKDLLSSITWQTLIIDEAQNIKNHEAKQTQAIKQFTAKYKVALTGTPVENRLTELWSIIDFLNQSYLGGQKNFIEQFAMPIERYHDKDATDRLKRLVAPCVLRRVKTDQSIIKDLPEKIETKVYCTLSKEQATLYESVVKYMLDTIKDSEGLQRSGLIFSTLTKLKQICNHPVHYMQDQGSLEDRSGKLTRLLELLEEILAEGDKALIFTQYTQMGSLLAPYLEKMCNTKVLFLHGGSTRKERDHMIEQFQNHPDAKLFILSLKAGGTGLNLTAASHVFHFDRWWNPAVENQATDRAFRIGQQKMVQVHKFICSGTLEEKIDLMIEQKKDLANLVVGGGEQWISQMTNAELEQLMRLDAKNEKEAT